MNDDEIREFLAAWLLHYGTNVMQFKLGEKSWYGSHERSVVSDPQLRHFFDAEWSEDGRLNYQINEKGLAFLKGENHG